MIRWYKNLYIGKNAKKREALIRHQLNSGRSVPGVYLITFAEMKDNQLEIFPAVLLKKRIEHGFKSKIVGIALGRREALKIITSLADEAYRIEGCESIRKYLENRE